MLAILLWDQKLSFHWVDSILIRVCFAFGVAEKCNVFVGNWVRDPTGPFYTNATCSTIEDHQNCMRNGRPDTDYIYWRWKPRDCNVPKFDPKKFLNMMRGKSLAFIGDSIMRNHVQSLLCMLSQILAVQASQFVAKHGTTYYKQLLEQNKQYIQEPPIVEKWNGLAKNIPGRTESFWKELDYVKNMWKHRQELKVEDAGIAALFGLKCFAWFCAGEIVGRGFTFTGYYP
ncbi:Uncharacterized protein Fot_35002 [Forsythia ovata]|uniref:Trichome birefringence-like N-terminal domain-containing protein n=1 Tax=Forsythia ovata TaxID=205694 RepID=A0ABD1SKA1_9LAMI